MILCSPPPCSSFPPQESLFLRLWDQQDPTGTWVGGGAVLRAKGTKLPSLFYQQSFIILQQIEIVRQPTNISSVLFVFKFMDLIS